MHFQLFLFQENCEFDRYPPVMHVVGDIEIVLRETQTNADSVVPIRGFLPVEPRTQLLGDPLPTGNIVRVLAVIQHGDLHVEGERPLQSVVVFA